MGRNFMFVSNSIETKNCNKHFFQKQSNSSQNQKHISNFQLISLT